MPDNDSSYPKVLIINMQSLNMNHPTGITLRSYFRDWPNDRIFELYRWKSRNWANGSLQIPSRQLPLKTLPLYYWSRKLLGKDCVYENTAVFVQANSESAAKKQGLKAAAEHYYKVLAELSLMCRLERELLQAVDAFAPEVIYTYGGAIIINRFVRYFSNRYHINVVVHYMDNWRETQYNDNGLTRVLNKILNYSADRVEKKMIKGLTISEKMASAYKKKSGKDFAAVMNCVDVDTDAGKIMCDDKETVVFSYAGGLPLKRGEQLSEVEASITRFNSRGTGKTGRLVVYTSDSDRKKYSGMFNSGITEFRDFLPHEEVYKIYEEADVLVYTEAFDANLAQYTKYSMSTKIPEYMASGKPVLCYAPPENAVCEYIGSTGSGVCAGSTAALDTAVSLLISDSRARCDFGKNGIKTALQNHSRQKTQELLRDILALNAYGNRCGSAKTANGS